VAEWSEAAYRSSVTGRAWTYTPYDWDSWEKCRDSSALRSLYEEEMAVGPIPGWAQEIVDRMITSPLPPCGHYTFPLPMQQVCRAIGQERCPRFVVGCYTADPKRKRLLSNVVYCLDAWLKEAPADAVRFELHQRDSLGKDWDEILAAVWQTLGDPTPHRVLLVRRLVHRLRWWIKTLVWEGDARNQFGLDTYLGDIRGDQDFGDYGQDDLMDPYFTERTEPEVRSMADSIVDQVPDGKAMLTRIEETWLCAPKAFRYVERLIAEIGAVGSEQPPGYGRSILQCDDTYPSQASARAWHEAFVASLSSWLDGAEDAVPELGPATPVKRWLVRLLYHRLELYGGYTRYVAGVPRGRNGTRRGEETGGYPGVDLQWDSGEEGG